MKRPIIVAMDFPHKEAANEFLQSFEEERLFLKVGMELFYKEGPALIESWKEEGHHIFLDLKLHDIPNTVKQAAKQIATLEVDMTTVHAGGGVNMMEAACEGLEAGTPSHASVPDCIAVTQLTSTSEEMMQHELLVKSSLKETVIHYARNAKKAGANGVVCSALEVPMIKEQIGNSLQTVTPGIRLANSQKDDQERVVTPQEARTLGSDVIVVGRSIAKAKNPREAYEEINRQWRNAE